MRCHLATTVTISPHEHIHTPIQSAVRFITRPLADGLNLTEHLVAGASAAAAAVSIMHPMDTIKTVVQVNRGTASAAANTAATVTQKKLTTFSALGLILRDGGLPALYKGLGVTLSGQVPANAIKFTAFETLTQLANSMFPKHAKTPPVDFICGALAFVACSVVLVPSELLKQRLQSGMYSNIRTAVGNIVKQEGPRALFTGYSATLFRDVPYTMLEFGLYSQFKRMLRSLLKKEHLTPQQEIMVGGIAGGCTGFLTTPLDLAKTRIMTSGQTGKYKGIVDVLVKVAKEEGFGGLFKGSTARVVWLIPFTAVFFGVHEASKRALLNKKLSKATVKNDKENKDV